MAVVQSQGELVSAGGFPFSYSHPRTSAELFDRTVDYAELWRTLRNLRQVVGFNARNFADLGLKIFERVDDDDRRALSGSIAQQVIDEPSPLLTSYKWKYALLADYLVYDRYYSIKAFNPVARRLWLVRIPPAMIQPHGSWLEPDGFELLGSKGPKIFRPDELFWDHGYNPSDNLNGCSPIESLREVLAEEIASSTLRAQQLRNGSRMSGYFKRPAGRPWTPEARKIFLAEHRAAFGGLGSNAGGIELLEDDMEFVPTQFSNRDSEFVAARQLTTQEVGSAYFTSPVFLGVLDNANFSNVKELHKHLYQDTLGPYCTQVSQRFKQRVLPEFQDIQHNRCYVEFNIAAKLAGSFEEQAAIVSTLVGRPIFSANEGRALFNKPRLDEGEGLVIPLNVIIGDQASPRDSAPPPDPANTAPKSAQKVEGEGIGQIGHPFSQKISSIEPGPYLTDVLTKGSDELAPEVRGWHAKHVEVLSAFFTRQKNSVVSKLGAGQTITQAWDTKRRDSELANALSGLSLEMVKAIASSVAEKFGGEFEPAIAEAWILNNARIGAENVNTATKNRLEGIEPDEDGGIVSGAKSLFEVAATTRAEQIAISRVTTLNTFATQEGGKQAGARYKRWNVRSSKSRHPRLDGERVKLGEKFSNGADGPGDPSLSEDQTAGCTCELEIEK